MAYPILFEEKQKYTKRWVHWLLGGTLLFVVGLFGTFLVIQLGFGEPVGNRPMSDSGLIISASVAISTTFLGWYLVQITCLSTRISQDGIYYRFSPFHRKEYLLKREEIKSVQLRTYSPLAEYGGWGMRRSMRNGKAYNIQGNQGIQVELKDGKKLLFGTQKPAEAEKAIRVLV